MHRLVLFITDFGDSAVLVPLAAVTMAFLFVWRRPRLALGWGLSIAGCAAAIGALKLALAGVPEVASPSGHVAMSTAVYGGFVALLGASLAPLERRAAALGAVLAVAGIAVSRLVLHEHTVAETAIGLVVGLAALGVFRSVLAVAAPGRLPAVWLCGAALGVIVLMHGTRWPVERAIHALAGLGLVHALLPGSG